ncbi:PIR Superfamily Protein [Plasmodium malariae]|uniref:PIR Superfamily Protein n=1 Tax=Plasmodium malariae TaxID=5858 RepID=A0A1A8WT88_PLAMA|nr:PIR Superfamily Protein [Plasmodium malariae]
MPSENSGKIARNYFLNIKRNLKLLSQILRGVVKILEKVYRYFSLLNNICNQEIKIIQKNVLDKLRQLYSYYENFKKFNGQKNDPDYRICNNIRECHGFYMTNYKECQGNNESFFFEELINFKKAYDNKMNKFTPCNGFSQTLPQIAQNSTQTLPPSEVDYIFFSSSKSWIRSRLLGKKMIELNKFQEETRESLQNLHDEVNRNYEKILHNIAYNRKGYT